MGMRVQQAAGHPMPEIAAFVADLKAAFGEQEIDEAIRRGKAGEPTFYARENGRSVGTAQSSMADACAPALADAVASGSRHDAPRKEREQ